ncbi:hypothetical protein HDU80_001042 [Chytriomyces hyalinus]|nr:hypothetical protein HDU80_001042 [Chytriomyces hyalinus]
MSSIPSNPATSQVRKLPDLPSRGTVGQEAVVNDLYSQLASITAERDMQREMISVILPTYQALKQRVLELVTTNEEMREILSGYIRVMSAIKTKQDRMTDAEMAVVAAFEAVNLLAGKSSPAFGSTPSRERSLKIDSSIQNHEKPEGNKTVKQLKKYSEVVDLQNMSSSNVSLPLSPSDEHPFMEVLVTFPMFQSFSEGIMKRISNAACVMNRRKGQTIIQKGDEGAEIFFLKEGSVSVVVDEEVVTVMHPITFFGELGVLFPLKRTATVIAKSSCEMIVVTKQKMHEIISVDPQAMRILEEFSTSKEGWWRRQQYILSHEKFGAEFATDIARNNIKKNGDDIITAGDESHAMYFVLSGAVLVIGQNEAVHAEIGTGSFFGEVGVLLKMKRTASIRAKGECHVFELYNEVLEIVLMDFPDIKQQLDATVRERYDMFKRRKSVKGTQSHVPDQFDLEIGSQSLEKMSIFQGVDKAVVSEIAMKLVRKTWEKNELIIKCNDVGNSMFFLAAGDASVTTEFGEAIAQISGPSAYFGEVAIIEQVPRIATVKCITTCSTYELRKEDFEAVVAKYPGIVKHIKQTCDDRMQNTLGMTPTLTELKAAASKLDNEAVVSLLQRVGSQEEALAALVAERITNLEIITTMKSTYENLKIRIFELVADNEKLRGMLLAHMRILESVRSKSQLTHQETNWLLMFDKVHAAIVNAEPSLKDSRKLFHSRDQNTLPRAGSGLSAISIDSTTSQAASRTELADVTILNHRILTLPRRQRESAKREHAYMHIFLRFPLFATLSHNVMDLVAMSSYEMKRKTGMPIISKGDEAAEMFFLIKGSAQVVVDDKVVTMKRTATVIARSDCIMAVITKQKLHEIVVTDSKAKEQFEQLMASKEAWWKEQQYILSQEKFGAEFANEIGRKKIKTIDLFSTASDAFLDSLSMKMKTIVFNEGQYIISIGEASDAMYFILKGSVEVIGSTGAVHALIEEGAFFGEVGVFLNMERTASVRAKQECLIFKLFKTDVDEVLTSYSSIQDTIKKAVDERFDLFKKRTSPESVLQAVGHIPDQFDLEIGTQSFQKISLFKGIDKSVLQELVMLLIRRNWEIGDMILVAEERGDSMFFLAAGTVDVMTQFGEVIDNVSGPSAYFGEVALLESIPRTASVKCTSKCSTYEMRKDDFKSVMTRHPAIEALIRETAEWRLQQHLMRNVLA